MSTSFFQLASNRRCGPTVSRFPACGGAFLRPSVRPVNTFFQLASIRFRVSNRVAVSRLRSWVIYPSPPGPSTLFFNFRKQPVPLASRCGFPQRSWAIYPAPCAPSTLFFNLLRFAFASRTALRFPACGVGLSTRARRPRQRFFSIPPRKFPPGLGSAAVSRSRERVSMRPAPIRQA